MRSFIIPDQFLKTFVLASLTVVGCLVACSCQNAKAADPTEDSIAAYSDAANFQTNGAFDLAIDGWKKFLRKYPKDELASKAAHYLGVCYMQKESPDYVAAAESFERALKDKKFELRQESLANQGWCWYASAGSPPDADESRLRKSLTTYETLRKENPKSQFLDGALFYSGEAAYALGERKRAVEFYDRMLSLSSIKDSALRCDALYARGIALEELDQFEKAFASYQQLIGSCKKKELLTDVYLRIGDVQIFRKNYAEAIASFESAFESADTDEDKSYALFRQGFALVQSGSPSKASRIYARLEKEFPNSKYAGSASLASAQSLYRGGDFDAAAKAFESVLQNGVGETATEAAHWLARIYISKANPALAAKVAEQQIDKGAEGDFAVDLKLDLAEALAMDPKTVERAVALSEQIYREAPSDELAPRALYNAAFSSLQINKPDKALGLAKEFLKKFASHTLSSDVQFILAEGYLMTGKLDDASKNYDLLLKATPTGENVQRPLWVLRSATTTNAAKKYDQTIDMMKREYSSLNDPSQKAEAQMLIGQAFMMSKRYDDAALAFYRSHKADPDWPRAEEAQLLSGTALAAAGKKQDAMGEWQKLIRKSKNRMADQARYKLAQLSSDDGDFSDAVKHYDEILRSKQDAGLIPYALYGKGWCLMQQGKHADAIPPLSKVISEHKKHAVGDDAMLARGISLRHTGKLKNAEIDLSEYLELKPSGTNLGHALYELALIDQKQKRSDRAAEKLARLVDQVPDYPSMEKVLYELGWSLRESGKDKEAEERFAELVQRFPKANVAGEAAYFVGQKSYAAGKWEEAAEQFLVAAQRTTDSELSEKAHYRLGWSYFKTKDFDRAQRAFADQATKHPNGRLALDAVMMVGECRFEARDYASALVAYTRGREKIRENNDNQNSVTDKAERQVRELILLHGGQSAAQQRKWSEAVQWYDELKERFPGTQYLAQMFYEAAFAYQQLGDKERALKYYSQVADKYRNELGARARFMMGELHFAEKAYDKAIPEFQRVMFGYGADKAPAGIKNWQAKSGFEAGRCGQQLILAAKSADSRTKSTDIARKFFQYVVDKHSGHELATEAREQLNRISQ